MTYPPYPFELDVDPGLYEISMDVKPKHEAWLGIQVGDTIHGGRVCEPGCWCPLWCVVDVPEATRLHISIQPEVDELLIDHALVLPKPSWRPVPTG